MGLLAVPGLLISLLRGHRAILGAGFSLTLVATALGLMSPLVWRHLLDEVLISRDQTQLPWVLAALVLIGLGSMVLSRLGHDVMAFRLHRLDADLRGRMHERILGQSLAYLHGQRTGDLLQRATADVNRLVWNTKQILIGSVVPFFKLAASLAIIAWLEWRLALLALGPVLLGAFFVTRFNRKIAESYREIAKEQGAVTAKLGEDLGAVHVIQGFRREEPRNKEYRSVLHALLEKRLSTLWQTELFYGTFQNLGAGANLAILCAGSYLVLEGELTIGALIAIRSYWGSIWWPINTLAETSDTLNQTRAAAERILEILDAPVSITFPEKDPEGWSEEGPVALVFEDVGFAYAPGRAALRAIRFRVEPGSRIAFAGASGAGKSTLLALTMRLYDPDEGRVTVNGFDLRTLPRSTMARLFASVEQEPLLFARSIRENVALARPDASEEEIREALQLANAREFVEALPDGLGTQVGERGVKLSGGQKQRLCIARAFLADPRVLLLDEATAAVEAGSEAVITEALSRLMRDRTTLMVTHKLHLARGCDEVLLIEDGQLVARGTHEELLSANDWYARTALLQRVGSGTEQEASG